MMLALLRELQHLWEIIISANEGPDSATDEANTSEEEKAIKEKRPGWRRVQRVRELSCRVERSSKQD